jgi:hypothetical protein
MYATTRRLGNLLLALGGALLVLMLAAGSAAAAPALVMETLTAQLTGATEVPGPGDADGAGDATLTIDTDTNEVCYTLNVSAITLPAAAAHVHKAPAGTAGGVVLPLSAPDANGAASGCATADAALVADMIANPAEYYVNVHTSDYPDGAVRGQLAGQAAPATPAPATPAPATPAPATPAPSAPSTLPTTSGANDLPLGIFGVALALLGVGVALRRAGRAR